MFNKTKAYVYNNILINTNNRHKPEFFIIVLVKPYCKRLNFS